MKHKLMMLLALTMMPAWAADTADAPPAAVAPAAQTAVTVQLSGSSKGVRALLAELEKDAVYKESGCSGKPMKKSAKTAKISCTNAGGALLGYLASHAPTKVRWSISGAGQALTAKSLSATVAGCPTGCVTAYCPPPSGPYVCCRRTPTGYQQC